MRKHFPEFYKEPSSQPGSLNWDASIFAFDANVLLNLYGYSKRATDLWLKGLDRIKTKIFLPYQAASEYHRNLDGKIEQIRNETSSPLLLPFEQIGKSFTNEVPKMNPLRDLEEFKKSREFFIEQKALHETVIKTRIEEWKKEFSEHCEDTKNKLADLFVDELIGVRPSSEEVISWCEEGRTRYAQNIPPGFKDATKEEGNPFGDLFIWFEMKRIAVSKASDVIFVTYENKPDWVTKTRDKTVVRKELTYEFLNDTGYGFDIAPADKFFDWLETEIGTQDDSSAQEVASAMRRADVYNKIRENLEDGMARLSALQQEVIRRRYGLRSGKTMTSKQVASQLGLPIKRIQQLEASALRAMRDVPSEDYETELQFPNDDTQPEDENAQRFLRALFRDDNFTWDGPPGA